MTIVNPCLPIITSNINGLNSPIKRQSMAEWIKKNRIQKYAAYQTLTLALKTHKPTRKGWKKTFQVNGNNNNNKKQGSYTYI